MTGYAAPEQYDSRVHLKARARAYRDRPYLRNMARDGLDQREHDILANLWATDAQGAVSPAPPNRRRACLELLTDLRAERRRRGAVLSLRIDEAAERARAAETYQAKTLNSPPPPMTANGLVRFGKRDHMEDAWRSGRFLIKPASSYDNDALTTAQRDNELRHHAVTADQQIKFRLITAATPDGPAAEARIKPLELYRFMEVSPFYVLCLSQRFDYRMFHDFEAHAALIIHDRETFIRRMNAAVASINPAAPDHGPAPYHDPYAVHANALVPGFSKHFRYAYQDEFRMIWRPKASALEPFFVTLGDLSDIAELVIATD